MANYLAQYVKQERLRKKLNRAQLAKLMGYKNVTKGMNRIMALENAEDYHPAILEKATNALNLNRKKVKELLLKEKMDHEKAFAKWADTQVPMELIVRYMAAVYACHPIPQEITTNKEAEEYACSFAREKGLMVCLSLSRRQSLWINKEGEVYHRSEATMYKQITPYMQLKKSKQRFLLKEKNIENS